MANVIRGAFGRPSETIDAPADTSAAAAEAPTTESADATAAQPPVDQAAIRKALGALLKRLKGSMVTLARLPGGSVDPTILQSLAGTYATLEGGVVAAHRLADRDPGAAGARVAALTSEVEGFEGRVQNEVLASQAQGAPGITLGSKLKLSLSPTMRRMLVFGGAAVVIGGAAWWIYRWSKQRTARKYAPQLKGTRNEKEGDGGRSRRGGRSRSRRVVSARAKQSRGYDTDE
jgi:hypothetical protein